MNEDELQALIEEATADFAASDNDPALAKLARATASLRRLDEALAAAERAHALDPADLFINTTLSRIWMERGDKTRAEHFGAQARMQGWKEQLKAPPPPPPLR
jgi:tetratricopeptide (TPR) repeat protein